MFTSCHKEEDMRFELLCKSFHIDVYDNKLESIELLKTINSDEYK
jgi:hypothetical protein